jgi:hypothetical protein
MKKQLMLLLNIFLCLMTFLGTNILAEIPSPDFLKQLEDRLLEEPDCLPHCADISNMTVFITLNRLKIVMTVHAAEDTIIPLPAIDGEWMPNQVQCNKSIAKGLRKDTDKQLWMYVQKGIHTICLRGSLPDRHQFNLPLVLKPRHIDTNISGWEIQGIGNDGQIADSIQLIRQEKKKSSLFDQHISASPFFHVQRVLYISVQWHVITKVIRTTPDDQPISIEIPLLQKESIITQNIQVKSNKALVSMKARQSTIEWQSVLKKAPTIHLKAPETNSWVETWILDADTKQHVSFDGIPVIHHQDSQGRHRPTWRPWPGEMVNIHFSQLETVEGKNLTIERVLLDWYPGKRFHQATLKLNIRVSMGQSHTITLPEKSIVQNIYMNRLSLPVTPENNKIRLPLDPGNHQIEIKWHQQDSSLLFFQFPRINVGSDAVNVIMNLHLAKNSWILWAGGPQMGPVVLFWSYVMLVLLVAFALGYTKWSPLKTWQWFLLGLGLTQIHFFEAMIVVGWFLSFYHRQQYHMPNSRLLFNLRQLLLVCATAAALHFIYIAIHSGLLGIPNMQINGNGSTWTLLSWYQDRMIDFLPQPWILFLPLYVFRIVMLVWALWMAQSLIQWIKWMWSCFSDGGIWRNKKIERSESIR